MQSHFLLSAEFSPVNNPIPHVLVGRVQIVVDHDLVMTTGLSGVLQLLLCLLQPLEQTVLCLRAPSSESFLQLL